MSDRDKLENLKLKLDALINTCKSEISITDKMISKAKSSTTKSKLQKEKIFWQGKLEVAEYARHFAN